MGISKKKKPKTSCGKVRIVRGCEASRKPWVLWSGGRALPFLGGMAEMNLLQLRLRRALLEWSRVVPPGKPLGGMFKNSQSKVGEEVFIYLTWCFYKVLLAEIGPKLTWERQIAQQLLELVAVPTLLTCFLYGREFIL